MPVSKPLTTDRQIAALKPASREYEASVDRGLVIRVYPTGSKVFEFRYRNLANKRRRLALGGYPDISLAKARLKASGHRRDVADGLDPANTLALDRQAAVAKAEGSVLPLELSDEDQTLAWLADGYFAAAALGLHGGRGKPKSESTLSVEMSRWKTHLKPKFGDRSYASLTRKEIKTFQKAFAMAGRLSADTIAGIGGTLSNILAFAVEEEWIETNPARGVTKPLATKSRTRMFDDHGLKVVWTALVQASETRVPGMERPDMYARLEPPTALALRFILLTLCRRNEVAGAQWCEINHELRTWTVPPERAKARKPHVVPLSDEAYAVINEARRLTDGTGTVFPAPGAVLEESIRPAALTLAMRRLCVRLEIPVRTPHDLRRTGATTLTGERYGVRRFIVSKVLSHNANDGGATVTQIYDLNEYLPDKRHALAAWGAHISMLAAGSRGAT